MIGMRRKVVLYASMVAVIMVAATFSLAKPASAGFSNNRVIDDGVFDNAATMDEGSIQSFLNSFSNSCLKNYQAPYPNDYFNYGGNVPAARVIKRAADLWGINPQVILTTLEKEESLVRGNAGCADWRYNSAMGMGCPDGGSCPAPAYAGFSKQVTKGSWQLKFNKERAWGNVGWGDNGSLTYYGYMTQGYRKRCASCSNIYYDGWTSIDNTSVHMDTAATASLYTYTPHFHGNQNFVALFEAWFGSTWGNGGAYFPPQAQRHPDGTIVKAPDSPTLYSIENGTLRSVGSEAKYFSFRYNYNDFKIMSDGDNNLPVGPTWENINEGFVIKGSAPTAYITDWDEVNGVIVKRSFVGDNFFFPLGYKYSDITQIPDNQLPPDGPPINTTNIHPDGVFVKDPNGPTIWYLANSKKYSTTAWPIFLSHKMTLDKVKTATAGDMALPDGSPGLNYREGALIKGASPTAYVVDYINGTAYKRHLVGDEYFLGWGFKYGEIIRANDNELPPDGPYINAEPL